MHIRNFTARAVRHISENHSFLGNIRYFLDYFPWLKKRIKWFIRRNSQIRTELTELLEAQEKRNRNTSCHQQLFLDISNFLWFDARTGIQRVIRNVLHQFLHHPALAEYRIELVYATPNKQNYYYAKCLLKGRSKPSAYPSDGKPIKFQAGDIFFGLDLEYEIIVSNRRFYQRLRDHGVRVVFIVHDLLPIWFPHHFTSNVSRQHETWLKVIANCDGAICVSRTVADELREWLDAHSLLRSDFRIDWFHLGADIVESTLSKENPSQKDVLWNHIATRPVFLMVGTLEPRKGHDQVLSAFELLWGKGDLVNLVIVGKRGWKVTSLIKRITSHPEMENRLFWFDTLSDEHLESLYALSTCLISASEGEGFGLPLIEAAQHGLPMIVRDIPVFREVAQNGAFYFSGTDADNLSSAIEDWLKLHVQGNAPNPSLIPWMTWQQSVTSLIEKLWKPA